MKSLKVSLIIIAAMALVLGLSGMSFAFHAGGVAHCDGCHSMHQSADNPLLPTNTGVSQLLIGSDPSSTCLNCHDHHGNANGQDWRYHVKSDDGNVLSSGGDFFWVANTYTYVVRGSQKTGGGDNHGHNIIAADFGLTQDANPSNQQAPGGTFSAAVLGCDSCHDPHGQVSGGTSNGTAAISASGSYGAAAPTDGSILGNYRLLHDDYTNPVPVATADSYRGKSVAYGSGMSEWCGNCHGAFQVVSNTSHRHPASNDSHLNGLLSIATNYNSYVASGDFTGTNNYDELVPIELGVTDGSLLCATDPFLSPGSSGSADNNSNVMCLTCHRAHASAHPNIGRWDFGVEFLEESHALVSNSLTAEEKEGAYYKNGVTIDILTEYGEWQRSLCNKCHVQD